MTKTTAFAAACAAVGLSICAAGAQEAPADWGRKAAEEAAAVTETAAAAGEKKPAADKTKTTASASGKTRTTTAATPAKTKKMAAAPKKKSVRAATKEAAGKRKKEVLASAAAKAPAKRRIAQFDVDRGRVAPKLVATARKAETVAGKAVAAVATTVQYGTIVSRYASAYGIPASLAHAVIRVESNYRVNALGQAGEVGLMQIKPATARSLGYSGSVKALYEPDTNIRYGMKYLAEAHRLGGGKTCGTILRYNAGHGATRMNPISAAYCSKVKRHLASN